VIRFRPFNEREKLIGNFTPCCNFFKDNPTAIEWISGNDKKMFNFD